MISPTFCYEQSNGRLNRMISNPSVCRLLHSLRPSRDENNAVKESLSYIIFNLYLRHFSQETGGNRDCH